METISVGTIVKSSIFAFGSRHDSRGMREYANKIVHITPREIHRTRKVLIVSSKSRPGNTVLEKADLGGSMGYDKSRGSAKFVVEHMHFEPGSSDRDGSHDGGTYVRARRLHSNESYDPNGELIDFYLDGEFSSLVPLQEIEVVGQLRMVFIP